VYKEVKVKANIFIYNSLKKEFEAKGKVKLENKEGSFSGEYIKYDLEKKTGYCSPAKIETSLLTCKGKEIEKIAEDRILIKNGTFSTCHLENPHYYFSAKEILVFPQKRIIAKNVQMYVWKIPIIPYIPYFVKSLEKDPTGMKFEWGYEDIKGYFFKTKYLYKWQKLLYGSFWIDFTEKMGICPGVNSNTKYSFKSGNGNLTTFYSQQEEKQYFSKSKNAIWNFNFQHSHFLSKEIKFLHPELKNLLDKGFINADVNVSNKNYFSMYGTPLEKITKTRDLKSILFFNKTWNEKYRPNFNIGIRLENHIDLETEEKFGYFPEITYTKYSKNIGKSNIFFDFKTKSKSYFRKFKIEESYKNYEENSVNSNLGLSYSRRFLQLDINPRLNITETKKETHEKEKKINDINKEFNYTINTSTTIFKIFDWKFFNLYKGMRHLIQPSVNYSYKQCFAEKGFFKKNEFSYQNFTDEITEKLQFNLLNAWQVKKIEKEYTRNLNLFKLENSSEFIIYADRMDLLTQKYYLLAENKLGTLNTTFSFHPLDNFYLTYNTKYDFDYKIWKNRFLEMSLNYNKVFNKKNKKESLFEINSGIRYAHYLDALTFPTTLYITPLQLKLHLTGLDISYDTSLNLMKNKIKDIFQTHWFTLTKSLHCWEAKFQTSIDYNTTRYTFLIYIKEFPDIMIQRKWDNLKK
ncbi:MAG: hypothetical protein ABIB46_02510, partial [bacterium]